MAIPTFVRMYWGRVKLGIDFDKEVPQQRYVLVCYAINRPVTNEALRWMGVHRDQASAVWGMCEIEEHGTGKVIFPASPIRFLPHDGDRSAIHVSISSHTIGRKFAVVFQSLESVGACVSANPELILGVGRYVARFDILADGTKLNCQSKFVVQSDGILRWSPN
jgi:hypothetical protein